MRKKALLRNLASAFILKERIKTTEAKAKELRSSVEKSITIAKKQNLSARRLLRKKFSELVTKKLVDDLSKRYQNRSGGYTRILKLGLRFGDAAKMAIIELV